jgi:Cytochrome c
MSVSDWTRSVPGLLKMALFLLPALLLAACNGSDGSPGVQPLIQTRVTALQGGTFSDNPANPQVSLTIPAGALSEDADLRVTPAAGAPASGPNQVPAGSAFAIALTSVSGAPLNVGADLMLEMAADPAPVHPQLGEIAKLSGTEWQRARANFFRASDNRVVALLSEANGTFRVLHRSRQISNDPGVAAGFDVFLNESFGNEAFFGGVLGLHTVLNGLPPSAAVALGVQVDLAKVPPAIVAVMTGSDAAAKDAALADPAITRALLQAGAVVGVKGVFGDPLNPDQLTSAGITCALCHQNVTPTTFVLTAGPTALPIGPLAVDGKANVAMDAGAILAATPFVQTNLAAQLPILQGWGPGRFDVRALPDNPLDDGVDNPTGNPPLWNFVDLQAQGYLLGYDGLFVGENALASQAEAVYDLVMHGNGAFGTPAGNLPPALRIAPPQALLDALAVAETAAPGNDLDTQKLLDLQSWMRSLASPAPGAFDEALAEEGFKLFHGRANCHACHNTADLTNAEGSLFTFTLGPTPGDLAGGIKVPSLRGVAASAPYLHNHSLATLAEVVAVLAGLGDPIPALTPAEQAALVEYLQSL